jgi:hypothetical protein
VTPSPIQSEQPGERSKLIHDTLQSLAGDVARRIEEAVAILHSEQVWAKVAKQIEAYFAAFTRAAERNHQ